MTWLGVMTAADADLPLELIESIAEEYPRWKEDCDCQIQLYRYDEPIFLRGGRYYLGAEDIPANDEGVHLAATHNLRVVSRTRGGPVATLYERIDGSQPAYIANTCYGAEPWILVTRID